MCLQTGRDRGEVLRVGKPTRGCSRSLFPEKDLDCERTNKGTNGKQLSGDQVRDAFHVNLLFSPQ